MRAFLLLPALVLAACSSPCEKINDAQADPGMQTCVFSATLDENASGAFTPEDGSPVAFEFPERPAPPVSFPDSSKIHDKIWVPQGGERLSYEEALIDSARHVIHTAASPTAYALAMQWSGDVRIHSADGERQLVVRVPEGMDESAARIGIRDWPNRAKRLAFAPDGAMLFAQDGQQNVMAWDATTGAERWTTPIPTEGESTNIMDVKPSPDGSRVAVPTYRALHLLDALTGARSSRSGPSRTRGGSTSSGGSSGRRTASTSACSTAVGIWGLSQSTPIRASGNRGAAAPPPRRRSRCSVCRLNG